MRKAFTFGVIICLCLVATINSFAKEPQFELYNSANDFYKEKNYAVAITLYDSIINQGFTAADLYFNLGNAYFKSGYLAPAILNYERALKLDPSNEDIDFNLKIVNLRVADKIEAVPELFFVRWVKNFVVSQSSDGWTRLSIVFIWIAFVCGIIFIFFSNIAIKRLSFFAGIILLILSLAFTFIGYQQYKFQESSQSGIVFVTNAYIKSAPDAESADLFILREGVKVKLLNTEGEWQRIKLADGKIGWIQKEQVEKI